MERAENEARQSLPLVPDALAFDWTCDLPDPRDASIDGETFEGIVKMELCKMLTFFIPYR